MQALSDPGAKVTLKGSGAEVLSGRETQPKTLAPASECQRSQEVLLMYCSGQDEFRD